MIHQSARLKITDHITKVRLLLTECIGELWHRYNEHDQTKLQEPEFSAFARMIPGQSKIEYGSDEYRSAKASISEAVQHHYRHTQHHPESFVCGIDDMTLIDLTEMIVDWLVSSRNNNLNGSWQQSLAHNAERFKMSDQLVRIFENTAKWLEECERSTKAASASGRGG